MFVAKIGRLCPRLPRESLRVVLQLKILKNYTILK